MRLGTIRRVDAVISMLTHPLTSGVVGNRVADGTPGEIDHLLDALPTWICIYT
jgi:hypothetical protein